MKRFLNLYPQSFAFFLCLCSLYLCATHLCFAQEQNKKNQTALELINQNFHSAIQSSFEKQKNNQPPLIVYEHRHLKLIKSGKIIQDLSIEPPPLYHQLKAISHLPLLLYLELILLQNANQLQHLQTLIQNAETELNIFTWDVQKDQFPLDQISKNADFEKEVVLARQSEILKKSALWLNRLAQNPRIFEADQKALLDQTFKDYFGEVREAVFKNISYCAYLHLSVVHTQAMILYRSLSVVEQQQVQAVAYGPKGPRADSLGVQYLAWLLKQKGENERVIYFEGKTDLDQMLKSLAKFNVELEMGQDLYGDPLFMQRDILGADAYQIMKKAIHQP
jgi:hypothetical protein